MSESIVTPTNIIASNVSIEQQPIETVLKHHRASPTLTDAQLELETKRARSSSMDILAEAATYTYGVEASAKRISPVDNSLATSMSVNNPPESTSTKKPEVPPFQLALPESSTTNLNRPRGATFSYSPYNSKDPSIEIHPSYRPIVNGNATPRTLNWFATAADEEVDTVQLLSGLSHIKKPLTPLAGKEKDIFNFGNFNHDSSSEAAPVASTAAPSGSASKPAALVGETDEGSTDLENDMSILAAVANQMNSDDANGGDFYGSPYMVSFDYSGRMRSNSMPLISYGTRSSGEGGFGRPRASSIGKEFAPGGSGTIIGAYTPEERRRRIQRFLEKRRNRVWTKKVKYDVRKNFADSRIRVKGRFIRKQDEEVLNTLVALPAVTPSKAK